MSDKLTHLMGVMLDSHGIDFSWLWMVIQPSSRRWSIPMSCNEKTGPAVSHFVHAATDCTRSWERLCAARDIHGGECPVVQCGSCSAAVWGAGSMIRNVCASSIWAWQSYWCCRWSQPSGMD